VLGQGGVADRVDAPVDRMESARLPRAPNCILPIAKSVQLPQGHDPVLLGRQSRQLMVTSPFGVHPDT
jgi:hypothetical protein